MEELKKFPIYMNAFEMGFLIAMTENERHKIPEIWKQLVDMREQFLKDAGVIIKDLGGDIIQLTDKYGNIVTRSKYEYEK